MNKFTNKYNWFSADLKKKSQKYTYIMYALAGLCLVVFFLAPDNIKMFGVVALIVAGYFMIKSWNFQVQDKKLRQEEIAKQQKLKSRS